MNSDLRIIVYCSTSEIRGTDTDIAAGISEILSVSRLKNPEAGITGALLYNDGYFAQILEGPANVLGRLVNSIQADPRNSNFTLALDGPAAERYFPDWSMAFGAVGEHPAISAAISAVLSHSSHSGEEILEVMKGLILKEDDWLL